MNHNQLSCPRRPSNICLCTQSPQQQNQQQMQNNFICSIGHNDHANFHTDKFELMVDVKGYKPEDLRVNILSEKVELISQKAIGETPHYLITRRVFELPQRIFPLNSSCFVNIEGMLNISAPWAP